MNKKNLMKRRNDVLRLIRFTNQSGSHRNCVRIKRCTTDKEREHRRKVFEICCKLTDQKKEFLTEARFLNNKRTDILVLDTWTIIEILNTETKEKCLKKMEGYPKCLIKQMVVMK